MNAYLTISLPHPPKQLRPNRGGHWRAKMDPKRIAREEACSKATAALRHAGDALVPYTPVGYSVRWYYWGTLKPDSDNVLASCKAYLDGIATALGVNDRDLECGRIERTHDKRNNLEIIIKFKKDKTIMYKPIDIPLTQYCASNAAALHALVSSAPYGDQKAMTKALVLAELMQGRLGSFIDRTRLALGIRKAGAPEVEQTQFNEDSLRKALKYTEKIVDLFLEDGIPPEVEIGLDKVKMALDEILMTKGGEQ